MSFQGHGHVERGAAHCHGHGHERRRPKSFWPMQGACAGSLSLSPYSSPYVLSLQPSLSGLMSFAARVRVDALPALPGLRFLHVFVFCGCANRESSTPGGGEREVEQGLFGLMTCGLNFPCHLFSPLFLLYCLLWFFARQPLCSYSILYGA